MKALLVPSGEKAGRVEFPSRLSSIDERGAEAIGLHPVDLEVAVAV